MRVIKRTDLMSKSEYHKRYCVSRPAIDAMIKRGDLVVEEISGKHYIRVKKDK